LELERSVSYQLSLVAAPVFGPDRGVVMAIAMFGFRSPLDADELTRAGDRVVAATHAVTDALHGHEPDVAGTRRAS